MKSFLLFYFLKQKYIECLPETVFGRIFFCFRCVQRHSTIESECHPHRWTRPNMKTISFMTWRRGAKVNLWNVHAGVFTFFKWNFFNVRHISQFSFFSFSLRFCSWQQLAFLHHVSLRRSGCSDIWTAATTDICHYKSCTTWNTIKWGLTTKAK